MTIDIPDGQFEELLAAVHPGYAAQLRESFKGAFTNPRQGKFPRPISLSIEARLGELQKNPGEEYIPFVTTKVF